MEKFIFITEKEYRTFLFPNGKMVDVYSCKFDCKVDLENETYIPFSTNDEYQSSTLPTMNDLIDDNIVKEVSCIENCYDIDNIKLNSRSRDFAKLSSKTLNNIIKEFKENGFNVTKRAVIHNFSAWLGDLKSGYRDEKNGYFLFSPCGCNPFSLRATTLHPKCEDWQQTYEW